ncbi:Tn3 family transposase [Francisella halioticida]|uniref:Tn3 family transposase n=1 Tax=Francisella halioticida TaxID=549298 RepID=UPI0023EA6190|nr:Tn3 family transposase [Francisella halioticida]
MLSELLEHVESENNKELGDQIKKLSPVAWQHIILLGNFVFSEVTENIDIKGIVKNALDKISKN